MSEREMTELRCDLEEAEARLAARDALVRHLEQENEALGARCRALQRRIVALETGAAEVSWVQFKAEHPIVEASVRMAVAPAEESRTRWALDLIELVAREALRPGEGREIDNLKETLRRRYADTLRG